MGKEKRRPVGSGAVEKPKKTYAGLVSSTTRPPRQTSPTTHPLSAMVAVDSVDLTALRLRLVGVRRRLLERLAEDWDSDRRFPDSAWTKLLADVQAAIGAVDGQEAEDL